MPTVTFLPFPTADKMNARYNIFYVLLKMLQMATKWLHFLKDEIQ